MPDCLESLVHAIANCPQTQFEMILVDNASTDDSVAIFNKYFLNSKILFLDKNYGFAGAVNRGLKSATSDWVLVCNNDLKIDSQWLSHVTKNIDESNDKLAAITGTVLSYDGKTIESQGLRFFINGKCKNINNGKKFSPSFLQGRGSGGGFEIWGASAALTLYNRAILEKVGQFDEDFFAYEEDVDLALRLHYLGYQTLYVPQAICYHLGGGTSSKMGNFRHIMDAKNWIYIIIKNYSVKDFLWHCIPIKIERLHNLSGLLKNTPKGQKFASLKSAYLPVIQNFSKMFQKRKLIQSLK